MSLQSWKDEFYPVDAAELISNFGAIDSILLDHSIRKWQGLTPENLEKHKVDKIRGSRCIQDKDVFYIDDTTCALCEAYVDRKKPCPCLSCPIYRHTGSPCFSEYFTFVKLNDPQPMLALLNKVKEKVVNESKD
jgi:hypothetical protein